VGNNPVTGGNSHGNPMEITVEGEISHGNQWEIPSDWKSGNSQWEITGLKAKYRGKSQWSGKFPVGNLEGSQKSHLQVHPRGHKLGDLLWCLASQQRAQHLGVSLGFGKKNVGKNRVISPRNGDFMEFGWDFTKRNDDFMGFEWDFTKRNGDFMGFTQGWVGNSIVLSRKICEFTDFIKKQLGNE
jgi:hypothetical protein